ncbi:MAG TPA: alpha-amylase family glycosyl hydrolase [Myxococcaceae bacterium]|nr:alpha-amylase family glycosyl hydrolase [Myxococcaceae bacterium]
MDRVRGWGCCLAAALVALGCSSSSSNNPGPKLHVPSPTWEEQVVYFVMTDRFNNGDKSNDNQGKGEFDPTDPDKYSGGDLKGLIDKLDYIQGLGATAVWITPPVANMWWDPLQQSGGYHGYWARHLKKVDEHLGTLDTYKALSDALHQRGMYLIQDVVPNHMGNFFTYSSYDPADPSKNVVMNTQAVPTAKPEQSPFDQDDPRDPAQRAAAIYHWTPVITDYFDSNQELNYQVSDLDDLNSESGAVRTALRDSYGYWIKEVGVDAFRVDTVKYVPHAFWNDFFYSSASDAPGMMAVARATGRDRFFAFGEVFENSDPLDDTADRKVASYLGDGGTPELPALLAYPLYTEINRVFIAGQPTAYLTYRLGRFMDPALYPNPYLTPTFIDNHDNQRFLASGSVAAMKQALAFLFTLPGIPVVYYGTEQDFTETRATMFPGGWASQGDSFLPGDRYVFLKKLADIRRSSQAFTHGALDVLYDNQAAPGALVYRRTSSSDTVLVLLNTSETRTLVSGLSTGKPDGTSFKVLDSEGTPPLPATGDKVVFGSAGAYVLQPREVLILQATSEQVTPPPPGATITVTTPIEGQTFTADVTLQGSVSPVSTALQMVLDGALATATPVIVASDGTFSIKLPVSNFPIGTGKHGLAFYAPDANVSTPLFHFTSNIVFVGNAKTVTDAAGDDHGPSGTYTYPQDVTFQGKHYGDIVKVVAEVGKTSMLLHLTMADWSSVWKPANGFDHVAFSIFFSIPGQTGLTVLPKLNASMPAGLSWELNQFTYGWNNAMYGTTGASATTYGGSAIPPLVQVDSATRTVTFTYNRNNYGLATWENVQVYIATWDFDGIGGNFRPLTPPGGQWDFGGGAATDPLIMDDMAPFALPAPPP